MSIRRYQGLLPRSAVQLLPSSFGDYVVATDNPVRAIVAFVQTLELDAVGWWCLEGGFNPDHTLNEGQNNLDLRIRGKSSNWLKLNTFIVSNDNWKQYSKKKAAWVDWNVAIWESHPLRLGVNQWQGKINGLLQEQEKTDLYKARWTFFKL